jgi:putative flippase GtrA
MKPGFLARLNAQQTLYKQMLLFFLVGMLLIFADGVVFIALTSIGISAANANLISRVTGAGLWFALNGGFTFRDRHNGPKWGYIRLMRLAVLWAALAAISTFLVSKIAMLYGMQAAWASKPITDLVLAPISFFISRHWVFR